jgi:glucose-6-phosphate 1-dehydrogenase
VINLQPARRPELHLLLFQGADNRRWRGGASPAAERISTSVSGFQPEWGLRNALLALTSPIHDGWNPFVRSDEQEEARRWVELILELWGKEYRGPAPMPLGTWPYLAP